MKTYYRCLRMVEVLATGYRPTTLNTQEGEKVPTSDEEIKRATLQEHEWATKTK